MGLSTSATHIIFFIASVVIAGGFIGVAVSVMLNISSGIQDRGDLISHQLSENFSIINDPERMSNNPLYLYLKNTGKIALSYQHLSVLIDGVSYHYSVLENGTAWNPGITITLKISVNLESGTHVVKVVLEDGFSKSFTFEVS